MEPWVLELRTVVCSGAEAARGSTGWAKGPAELSLLLCDSSRDPVTAGPPIAASGPLASRRARPGGIDHAADAVAPEQDDRRSLRRHCRVAGLGPDRGAHSLRRRVVRLHRLPRAARLRRAP